MNFIIGDFSIFYSYFIHMKEKKFKIRRKRKNFNYYMNKYEYHICVSYANRNKIIKSYE